MTLMMVVSATKAFTGSVDQHTKVAESRANAYSFSSGAYDCLPALLPEFITALGLKNIITALAPYPTLKITIYRSVLHDETQLSAQIKQLLTMHQMTTFNMIYQFVEAPGKTAAHLHPTIVSEYNKWFAVLCQLRASYGDDWHYYKLFQPNGTITATALWPSLAACGVFYTMSLGASSSTIKNLKSSRINRVFPVWDLLSIRLKPEFALTAIGTTGSIASMTDEAARHLGIHKANLLAQADSEKWFEEVDKALLASHKSMKPDFQGK